MGNKLLLLAIALCKSPPGHYLIWIRFHYFLQLHVLYSTRLKFAKSEVPKINLVNQSSDYIIFIPCRCLPLSIIRPFMLLVFVPCAAHGNMQADRNCL